MINEIEIEDETKIEFNKIDILGFKRKYKWTFEIREKDGKIVFPETLVKINQCPRLHDNEITIFHSYDMILKLNFDTINGEIGILKKFDECGSIIEEWHLGIKQIKVKQNWHDTPDEVYLEWTICYKVKWTKIEYNKKKYLWTFTGHNLNKRIFPETLVKIDQRPYLPYMAIADENGGKLVAAPGEIKISYIAEHLKFNDEQEKYKIQEINNGVLNNLRGQIVECWFLEGIKIKSFEFISRWPDEFPLLEFVIRYESAKYTEKT